MADYVKDAVLETVLFAAQKHARQTRKMNGEPYICHPIRVGQRLMKSEFATTPALKAAILHDVLEDTNTTVAELEEKFGVEVTRLVQELTNDKALLERYGKTEYLRTKLLRLTPTALAIKLCDRYDNIHDLPPAAVENKWACDYAQQTYIILKGLPEDKLVKAIRVRLGELGYLQLE